ncbi:hypothetical protein [Acidithiobacillus thiooxidans]|uniref:hypothetical protein n=1 Tax=Acidithiobacillus thiooxidans TaxID=930 RepID=UPI0011120141|nr:hypothetical protein [Acidithiobacillus thiooxidans]
MKIHKFTASLSFALALVPMVAMANAPHQWWVLTNTHKCENVVTFPTEMQSPYSIREWLLHFGPVHFHIHHLHDNRGLNVNLIGYPPFNHQRRAEFNYFSTKHGCQYVMHRWEQDGRLHNLNELK